MTGGSSMRDNLWLCRIANRKEVKRMLKAGLALVLVTGSLCLGFGADCSWNLDTLTDKDICDTSCAIFTGNSRVEFLANNCRCSIKIRAAGCFTMCDFDCDSLTYQGVILISAPEDTQTWPQTDFVFGETEFDFVAKGPVDCHKSGTAAITTDCSCDSLQGPELCDENEVAFEETGRCSWECLPEYEKTYQPGNCVASP